MYEQPYNGATSREQLVKVKIRFSVHFQKRHCCKGNVHGLAFISFLLKWMPFHYCVFITGDLVKSAHISKKFAITKVIMQLHAHGCVFQLAAHQP